MTSADVERWLAEDLGDGDVTSWAVVDEHAACSARVLLREPGIVCGLRAAGEVFARLGAELDPLVADGSRCEPGLVARAGPGARRAGG